MGVALVPASSVQDAESCYIVIEQSDAMAPEIRPGARVLIEETHDYEDGDVLLVTIPERGTHLRRLATRRGRRVLVADNAAGSVPLDEVEVLGVAIETINPLRRRRRGLNGGH